MHLYQLVQRRAERLPHAVALGGQDGLAWKTLDSSQLLDRVDRLAAELCSQGVGAGDRVVLWLPNHWRTPVYLFALWKLGAIIVPFDREMNPEAGASILESVEPRLVLVGYDERPAWAGGRDLVDWWEPGARGGAPTAGWEPPSEDLAAIVFTSGTTGSPKGCMITHANLLSQIEAGHERIALDARCRLASILPLSHLFELTCGLLYPLDAGAAVHYIPSRRGPDIVRVLAEQRVTHMMAVPQLLAMMGHALDQQLQAALPPQVYAGLFRLTDRLPLEARRRVFWMVHRKLGGQLRLLAAGGAPLAPETHRFWERLGVRVVQGYGTSECSPIVACGRHDGTTPVGSVGPAIQGVEVQLNAEGELLVKGPNVMRGYWKDPARTADVLRDGWYATGDLARIDEHGNIWLIGRAKDLIVLPSGMNVWPQDIEDVLRANPAVRDAAVVAAPTAAGGATLHAYLIGESSADVSGIIARANGRLAQHQRLASASWWSEPDFPRTSTLKVRRHLLPAPQAAEAIKVDMLQAADDPVAQAVAGVARVRGVQPGQTLGQLGLDSLGLVDLALALEEKTGKAVADGDLRLDQTIEDVRALLARARTADDATSPALAGAVPLWPYTWGRAFRFISAPFDLLYRLAITRTVVLGGEHLAGLPPRVIVAGTHHSFADVALVRYGLGKAPARRLASRLVVAAGAGGPGWNSPLARYAVLAWGLYPLQQTQERDASLRGLVRLAQAGNAVLIFPQGTHARREQERQQDPSVAFRPGVAHLARALDAAVVPFGLAGTEQVMPAFLEDFHGPVVAGVPVSLKRLPLAIAFGPPLTPGPDEDAHAFAARLQAACYALTDRAEQALRT